MEELGNIAQLSLVRYFNVLEKTGYVDDSSVNKLILLLFLNDFLNGFQGYITEKDYQTINNIINCLTNTSCLIPFRQYKLARPISKYYLDNTPVRVIEENDVRDTENGALRLPETYNQETYWQPDNN